MTQVTLGVVRPEVSLEGLGDRVPEVAAAHLNLRTPFEASLPAPMQGVEAP